MMRILLAAAVLTAPEAAPPSVVRDGVLTLRPGEEVVLKVQRDGVALVEDSQAPPEQDRPGGDVLRLRLEVSAGASILEVGNGYATGVNYDATMFVSPGEGRPTSICTVGPNMTNFENWPHPVIQLELHGFELLPQERWVQHFRCR